MWQIRVEKVTDTGVKYVRVHWGPGSNGSFKLQCGELGKPQIRYKVEPMRYEVIERQKNNFRYGMHIRRKAGLHKLKPLTYEYLRCALKPW